MTTEQERAKRVAAELIKKKGHGIGRGEISHIAEENDIAPDTLWRAYSKASDEVKKEVVRELILNEGIFVSRARLAQVAAQNGINLHVLEWWFQNAEVQVMFR